MTQIIFAVIGGMALALLLRPLLRLPWDQSDRPPTAQSPAPTLGSLIDLELRLERSVADLDHRLEQLVVAVSEGITGYQRHEKRVQKTVASARRLVASHSLEHAGIEAEFAELEPSDDSGIEPLPSMPTEVEPTRTVRFPGGSLEIGAA